MPRPVCGQVAMIHAGDHDEAKVVGNTVARRLLDGGAVVERVQRCDDRIREAVSPSLSRLCRRKLAARLAHAIASHIGRDAPPGVRDPRGSRNVGGSVVRGEIGRLWGLEITFRRPTMDCVAHPAGALPWNSPWSPSSSRTPPTSSSASRILSRPWKTSTRRWSGTDAAALALARDNALAIGAGHTFLIFLGDGFFPVNVLAAVRAVSEVCRIYCATANPAQVIVAQTELGRGVLGVVDGASPLGVETEADITWRKDMLRKIGYKL